MVNLIIALLRSLCPALRQDVWRYMWIHSTTMITYKLSWEKFFFGRN